MRNALARAVFFHRLGEIRDRAAHASMPALPEPEAEQEPGEAPAPQAP